MTLRHVTVLDHQSIAHLGRRTRYRCRICGEYGPWTSKDGAEEGRTRHEQKGAAA